MEQRTTRFRTSSESFAYETMSPCTVHCVSFHNTLYEYHSQGRKEEISPICCYRLENPRRYPLPCTHLFAWLIRELENTKTLLSLHVP